MKTIINVKWGIPAEQPTIEELPSVFSETKALWSQDSKGNYAKIISHIEPYLSASLILSEIPAYEELFKTEDDLVEADSVRIVGVDCDVSSPIPSIKAEAEVELKKKKSFSNIDLGKWQEENEFLYDGISFYWSFDDLDSNDLDTCIRT